MGKMKLLEKKLNMSKDSNIILPVFSEEAYIKCKMGTKNDYYNLPCVEDMAFDVFTELEKTNLQSITFAVIDDEYFDYLEKNNLEDSSTTRNNYCYSLDSSTIERLWKKSGYFEGFDWGIIPVIMENPTYTQKKYTEPTDIICEYSLSKETIKELKKSLMCSFTEGVDGDVIYNLWEDSFYISNQLLNIGLFDDDDIVDNLFNEGVCALHLDKTPNDTIQSRQIMKKEAPLGFFGIFIMYKYEVPSTISLDYIDNAKNATINLPMLDVDTIELALEKDIDITFELLTLNIVYPEYVEGAIEEFKEYCIEKFAEKAQALETMNDKVSAHCKVKDKKKKKKK